jgi:type I restriction enzyme S subunit
MSEFTRVRLSDFAHIITGSTPSAANFDSWGDELDFITPSDQSDDAREATPSRRLSAKGAERLAKRIVPARSTNLTCIGSTIGKVSLAMSDAVTNQQINSIVARKGLAEADFVYYLIKNWSGDLKLHASGSATPIINKTVLSNFQFALPQLWDQRAIAEVLGALDDKIAANNGLAGLAFQLASSIFEHARGASATVAPLCEIATTILGGTPARNNPDYWEDGDIPWINSGKANEDRILQPSEYISAAGLSNSAAKMMPTGATVIAITGATLGQLSRLEISAAGNQSLVGAWGGTRSISDWLHFAIRDEIPQLLKRSTGAAQQHVNKNDVDGLVLPIISGVAMSDFSQRVSPLLDAAAQADRESLVLAKTRDTLLPQLMSGKLRVKDAEKSLEEVL